MVTLYRIRVLAMMQKIISISISIRNMRDLLLLKLKNVQLGLKEVVRNAIQVVLMVELVEGKKRKKKQLERQLVRR